jgi:transposase
MLIIGCDYHPSFQQIAFVETETGELSERRLVHREEAEQFYGELREQNAKVRVGMEASGQPHSLRGHSSDSVMAFSPSFRPA